MLLRVGWSCLRAERRFWRVTRVYCSKDVVLDKENNLEFNDTIENIPVFTADRHEQVNEYYSRITGLTKSHKWEEVRSLLEEMKEKNITLSPFVRISLLKEMVEQDLKFSLEFLKNTNHQVADMYNVIMGHLTRRKDKTYSLILDLYNEMLKKSLPPCSSTLFYVTKYYLHNNDVKSAESVILNYDKKSLISEVAIRPLLIYYRKLGNVTESLKWINWMYQNDIEITGESYHDLILAHLYAGKVNEALNLIERIHASGIKIFPETFNATLQYLNVNFHISALLKLFKMIPSFGLKPQASFYYPVIHCLTRVERYAEARKYLMELFDLNIDLLPFSINYVFQNGDEAKKILSILKERDCPVHYKYYNSAVEKLSAEYRFDEAKEMLLFMKSEHITIVPDSFTKYAIMQYSKNNNIDEFFELYADIVKDYPNEVALNFYKSLVNHYPISKDILKLFNIFREMETVSVVPDKTIHKLLLSRVLQTRESNLLDEYWKTLEEELYIEFDYLDKREILADTLKHQLKLPRKFFLGVLEETMANSNFIDAADMVTKNPIVSDDVKQIILDSLVDNNKLTAAESFINTFPQLNTDKLSELQSKEQEKRRNIRSTVMKLSLLKQMPKE